MDVVWGAQQVVLQRRDDPAAEGLDNMEDREPPSLTPAHRLNRTVDPQGPPEAGAGTGERTPRHTIRHLLKEAGGVEGYTVLLSLLSLDRAFST
jgi:hypothetical protein